jgi:hypothetical protein
VIRPPSCLSFLESDVKLLVGKGIDSYSYDAQANELTTYFRSFSKAEAKKVSMKYYQTATGSCTLRPYTASFISNGDAEVQVTPAY